jgi:hypothetical protein
MMPGTTRSIPFSVHDHGWTESVAARKIDSMSRLKSDNQAKGSMMPRWCWLCY